MKIFLMKSESFLSLIDSYTQLPL